MSPATSPGVDVDDLPEDPFADDADLLDGGEALVLLRKARRSNRLRSISVFDALYRAYTMGLGGTVIALLLSNVLDDERLDAKELLDVRRHGPALVGLAVAGLIAFGMRSGSRGGPLALEAADVRHVLLGPVDRGAALRPAALRQLRSAAFIGACVGALVGVNAAHRLPHPAPLWAVVDGLIGLVLGPIAIASALVVSGLRLGRRIGGLAALLVLLWSGFDVWQGVRTSPASFAGGLLLSPLHFRAIDLIGVVLVLLVPLGVALVGGTSLEECEHRAKLVGVARFAATVQDVRTVLVVRRQLAQELPRSTPWLPVLRAGLGTGVRHGSSAAAARRSFAGVLRWPLGRVARLLLLAATAGICTAAARNGTTPLAVVAAGCCWLAGLDLVEALGQEEDHPSRLQSVPYERGRIHLALLLVPAIVSIFLVGVAALAAVAVGAPADTTSTVAIGVLPFAAAGVVLGAAMTTLLGAQDPVARNMASNLTPELAGVGSAYRAVFPVLVAGAGPVIAVAGAVIERGSATATTGSAITQLALPATVVLVLIGAWIRFRAGLQAFQQAGMTGAAASGADGAPKPRAAAAAKAAAKPEAKATPKAPATTSRTTPPKKASTRPAPKLQPPNVKKSNKKKRR